MCVKHTPKIQEIKIMEHKSQSEEIKDLVAALSKAQGMMKPAIFNRVNPHFKNRYADFTSCMDSCRDPLSNNGLSVMQYCETINDKLMLVTMLAHISGQWIKSYFPLSPKSMESQAVGSAMTYAKRYSLSALLGIVSDDEDDDGEASHGRTAQIQANKNPKPISSKIIPSQISVLKGLESKFDEECKNKLYSWLDSSFKVKKLEDLLEENFQKVLLAFQNASKYMEQQQEVAHA